MSRLESFRVLGTRVDRLTLEEALAQVQSFLKEGSPRQIVTANTLMCLEAAEDSELRAIIQNAALVVPESWGIQWASRRVGMPLKQSIPGIDLMTALCEMLNQLPSRLPPRIFLLGSAPGVAEETGAVLGKRYPALKIVGEHHGYFAPHQEPFVVQMIREAKPAVLFVGMGMPAQEKWIARHLVTLGVPVVMGVGGSFDVLSGQLKRAPGWMRRAGAEWLYRWVQEPWRWRRIAQLPVFMWRVFKARRLLKP